MRYATSHACRHATRRHNTRKEEWRYMSAQECNIKEAERTPGEARRRHLDAAAFSRQRSTRDALFHVTPTMKAMTTAAD